MIEKKREHIKQRVCAWIDELDHVEDIHFEDRSVATGQRGGWVERQKTGERNLIINGYTNFAARNQKQADSKD